MKRVLLKHYAHNNLGDDLFVKIIIERYAAQFTILLSRKNKYLESASSLEIYSKDLSYYFIRAFEKVFHTSNLRFRRLANMNDLVVHIGGSLFIEGHNPDRWTTERRLYEGLSSPYYILGSNVGPYKSREFIAMLKNIFRNAADVCFRDSASYATFAYLPTTRMATDIAFTLDTSRYEIRRTKTVIISVIDCSERFNNSVAEQYDKMIGALAKRLADAGYDVVLMSFCEFEGDEVAIQRIYSQFSKAYTNKVKVFRYDGNLEEAVQLIANCEIMVGSRLHATILGLLFKKKVLPIIYSDKTTRVLHDMNFQGSTIDLRKLDQFNPNELQFANLKPHTVNRQVKLAGLQFEVLDTVLDRKSYEQA